MERRNATLQEFDGDHNNGPHRCDDQVRVVGHIFSMQSSIGQLSRSLECPRAQLNSSVIT